MNPVEEKAVLTTTIDTLRREARIITENISDKNQELATLVSFVKQNDELLDKSRTNLTAIVNRISEEKLAWSQEKHEEWAKIEARNAEIDRIVAKEAELEKKEAVLALKEEKLAEDARKNSSALLTIKDAEVALAASRREHLNLVVALEGDRQVFRSEKEEVKKQVTKLLTQLQKI